MDTTVMGFIIHKEKEPDRLVTMGSAAKAVEPKVEVPEAPQPPTNKGRKRMGKEKDLDKAGTKTIREDDAGEKGAVGSHGANAPAQEKTPEGQGNKEDESGD